MKLTYNDKEHAYWLDGRRCKGVTTVAGWPQDKYKIDQWEDRMIVIGMARNPGLVHRAAAHFDQQDKIQEIAQEAFVAAKAHEASGRGTADHRITERIDLGLEWIDTPANRAIAAAWTQALDQAGVDIDPELCERIIVYPDLLLAGRYDRIGRYRTTGRPVGIDIKTGANAIRYPHSTVVQLAIYMNAPLQAVNLRRAQNRDGQWIEWTDQFEPLPDDLHRDHAIVVHIPPEGPAKPWRFNIARGWTEAAQAICFPTIAWRNIDTADLIEPLDNQILVAPTTSPERLTWIRARVQAIVDAGHEDELAGIWNTTKVPIPLTADTPLSDAQVDTLVGWCTGIEALAGLPFEPTDPLFTPFTPTPAAEPPPAPDPGPSVVDVEAQRWAEKARELVAANIDENEVPALLAACEMTGTETMTADLYERLEAVISELVHPDGAVGFMWGADDTITVQPTSDAMGRMQIAAGGVKAAYERAASIAKKAGHIAPRTLAKAAEIPLYAAMVAAGHGTDNTTNNKQEQPA